MALKDLLTDLSKFKYTNYENVGANNSQVEGRHGGTIGAPESIPPSPPHPEEHSKFDDKVGKFRNPQYAGVTSGNEIPFPGNYDPNVGGIHGGIKGPTPAQPLHSDDHSLHDDGVGFGVAPNVNPQSFNVRGYTITGTKTFDRPNQDAITIMTNRVGFPYTPFDSGVKTGPVNFLSGVYGSWGPETFPLGFSFNMVDSLLSPGTPPVLSLDTLRHTIPEVGSSPSFTIDYSRYDEELGSQFNTVEGNIRLHTPSIFGLGEYAGLAAIGGGVTYYGSLVSITPRGSIYRADDGTYRVPQEGVNTLPPGGISGIPEFTGTQITHNIPQIVLSGPFGDEDYQSILNTVPHIPNAHGSAFMITPLGNGTEMGGTSFQSDSLTHNVDMITLSGPTTQAYQTTLNTTPIVTGAHGSDFQTTPIEAYSSIFATQDGLLMDTIYDSGFNRSDMYIKDHLHQSHPEFKVFNRTEKSLNRIKLDSPNFDSDGNKKFTFKDRVPYNIPARDNTVFGFDQPFILKDIGDKWGPGGLGAVDEGIFRGGFVTSAARTVADVFRLGKFILTPKGIMFGLKQAGLQLLNPRKETTIWNPLSLGSIAPMVHMDRHFGGLTYESVINFGLATFGFRPGSILYAYGTAVNLPKGNILALEGVTATRVTGAHIVGMVPSAGGVPGTFPSIPEIDIDLSGGNITSLTVGTNKYGPKTLLGNKKYTVSDGTPIIPARNPEAGFKSGILGGRFAGSPFTTMFLNEDGLFPSKALTDAVKRTGIFEGNEDTQTAPYFVKTPGDYLLGDLDIDDNVAVLRTVAYGNPIYGIGPQVSIFNPLSSTPGKITNLVTSRDELSYIPLDPDYPAQLQIRKEGIFEGDFYSNKKPYASGNTIASIQSSTQDDISGYIQIGNFLDVPVVDAAKKRSTYTHLFEDSSPIIPPKQVKDFGTAVKVATLSQPSGESIRTLYTNHYKEGTLYLSGHGTSILPITPTKVPAGVSIGKKVGDYTYSNLTTLYEEDINPKPTSLKDSTFPNFSGDLYHKDNKYTDIISIDETQSSTLTKTRLRIDDDKDPAVKIETAHLNTARFNVDGKSTLEQSIKLQNFPLFNAQSGGNLGSEKQALGFIDESGTPIQLADSLYGHQWNADKRTETTKDGYEKNIKSVPATDKEKLRGIVDEGRFGLSDNNIPRVVKKLFTKNVPKDVKNIDDSTLVLGDNEIESQIVQNIHERKSETNKSGNLLDRYKTLAYGDIPKNGVDEERYGKKTVKTDKGGQYRGQEKDEVTKPNKLYEIPAEDKLGLVKKNVGNTDYMYGHGTGIGEPDSINMTKYGDDSEKPDYIKFKFFDIVNNKHIIFRAFLSGISETLSPEWASERYIGRPDSVHVYQGVDRSMSFEFMVVPSSKQELPILWEKLNYLVGFTYPTWKTVGNGKRMEAPFINLTIGDMYNAVPGFLSGLTITVDDQSPWEIEEGFQLPHAVNVSCEFTHIGKHPLASIGKHYDLGWLKRYDRGAHWKQEGNPQLLPRTTEQLTDLMGT